MADEIEGVEKQARSVPLPTDEGDQRAIAQQNVGPDSESGCGEWPSPQTAPSGPSPGTTPEGAQAASRREQAPPRAPGAGSASAGDRLQDAGKGGDRGPARTSEGPASFNEVLGADPLAGGSQSAPGDGEEVDPNPS